MRGATSAVYCSTSTTSGFNPRAPCGARPWSLPLSATRRTFQSTRPVWGATSAMLSGGAVTSGFNPRAPCGARRILKSCWQCIQRFNPRAPCGARPLPRVFLPGRAGFNPRAPCGARRQKRSRLPSSATYLWVFPSTNTIFSAPKPHAPPAA